MVVTGAPGMGKTTLINDLLGLRPRLRCRPWSMPCSRPTISRGPRAYEFGINVEGLDTATVLQRIKTFHQSHRDGRPPLLVVDEAQNLEPQCAESAQTANQPGRFKANHCCRSFSLMGRLTENWGPEVGGSCVQQVTAAAHLNVDPGQTAAYIPHWLKVVGWNNFPRIRRRFVLPVIEKACPRRAPPHQPVLQSIAVEEKAVLGGRCKTRVPGTVGRAPQPCARGSRLDTPTPNSLTEPEHE